jgi:hypothetical protein
MTIALEPAFERRVLKALVQPSAELTGFMDIQRNIVPDPFRLIDVTLPSRKENYLAPFEDYPNYRLAHASAEEAAQFIVGYAAGHVRYSPRITLLTMNAPVLELANDILRSKVLLARIENEMSLGLATGSDKGIEISAENFDSDKFIRAIKLIAAERVGDSTELSWVAGLALKAFGCPYAVTIMDIQGTMSNGDVVSHNWVKIDDGKNAWHADPFLHLLTPPQMYALLGRYDYPAYWPDKDLNAKPILPGSCTLLASLLMDPTATK